MSLTLVPKKLKWKDVEKILNGYDLKGGYLLDTSMLGITCELYKLGYNLLLIRGMQKEWCVLKDGEILFNDDRTYYLGENKVIDIILNNGNYIIKTFNSVTILDSDSLELKNKIDTSNSCIGKISGENIIASNTIYDMDGKIIKSYDEDVNIILCHDCIKIDNDNGKSYLLDKNGNKISEDYDYIDVHFDDNIISINNIPLLVPYKYYRDFKTIDTNEPLTFIYEEKFDDMVPKLIDHIIEEYKDPETLRLFGSTFEAAKTIEMMCHNFIDTFVIMNKTIGYSTSIIINSTEYILDENNIDDVLDVLKNIMESKTYDEKIAFYIDTIITPYTLDKLNGLVETISLIGGGTIRLTKDDKIAKEFIITDGGLEDFVIKEKVYK